MAATVQDILRPIVFTKTVSRVAQSSNWMLATFGMGPNQSNEVNFGHGRTGSYRVFNNVRTAAKGRAPMTAAGTSNRNPVGEVPFVYPRMHDSIMIFGEETHNLSRIDDPTQRDIAGMNYLEKQIGILGQKGANWRAQQLAGMLRDSLYIVASGDDWRFSFSDPGTGIRVNYQMPSGNKTQLDMTGGGNIIAASWAAASTDIPGHCKGVNKAFLQLYGGRLKQIWVTSTVWNYVVVNDFVAAGHGIANPPFAMFEQVVAAGPDGTPVNAFRARLNNLPGVDWYITDDGTEMGAEGSETWTQFIEDTAAVFVGEVPPQTHACYVGSEPIREWDEGPMLVKTGFNAWTKGASNPTGTTAFVLDNALCVNEIPASIAYGTVVF